ncbi:MAG TPA: ABC transporter permease [Vicinamibacterales bacterium]|nr:ABC transporter permease [Vicinamibacterales bacterium]
MTKTYSTDSLELLDYLRGEADGAITHPMWLLSHDLRLACRRLRLAPGFTLFAVASLALGIGITTVVYSGVRTLLWRPLGVPNAEQLMAVRNGRNWQSASWPDFTDLRQQQTTFRSLAAVYPITTAIGAGDGSQTILAEAVSGDYFAVAGVRARLGRLLDAVDESEGARVVVVSESFWEVNLHAEPSAIGRTIKIGGEAFELVGVVAGPFHGLQPIFPHSAWLPVTAIPRNSVGFRVPRGFLEQRAAPAFEVWGRLRSPRDFGNASAEVALIGRRLEAAYPKDEQRGTRRQWRVQADAATPPDNESRYTIVFMILTGIATVLLIACTNLANLALAKGTARAQETAIRTALGASRWRLIREQLIEALLIVGTGGLLGVLVMLQAVHYWAIDVPMAPGIGMRFPQVDVSVFVASFIAMAVAVIILGLWPAVQSSQSDVRSGLGAGLGATTPKWRLHRTIITWQICGSVALLLVSLLTVKAISAAGSKLISRTTHGDLALAQIDFGLNGRQEDQRVLTAAIVDNVRASGRVRDVAAANGLPFGWRLSFPERTMVWTEGGFTEDSSRGAKLTTIIAATPSFLSTVGIRILSGRGITNLDDAAASRIAVINEASARDLFRSTDVLGRLVYLNAPRQPTELLFQPNAVRVAPPPAESVSLTIVGICKDDQPAFSSGKPDRLIFVPFAQRYQPLAPVTFVARADEPSVGVAGLRMGIQRVDPDLAVSIAGTGAVLLDGPLVLVRIIVAMTAALGTLALVLSMAGLFGVLSHLVNKRTREIGIRLAIGAERSDIFRLVLRDGLRPVTEGLAIGLGIGVAARIAVKAWVVTDVAAVDPLPLLLLPVPFAIAAFLASYVPAARAARVDPNVALRDL